MSLAKIVVSGKVVRAPEKRFTPNTNVAVTEFAISVESAPKQDGTVESSVVKVTAWRDLAERCAQEIKKGDLVAVDGRLQINNFTNPEGQRKRDVEIDAIFVENLSYTLANSSSLPVQDEVDKPVAVASARQPKKATSGDQELESIFANEDEIPF